MKKTLVFFLLLGCLASAVDVNFKDALLPQYYFNTDVQLSTDFTLSLVSGEMASGNPADIQGGDTVCTGAVLQVTPTYNSKWAVSKLNVYQSYPGGCAAMQAAGPISYNRNIRWFSPAVYAVHDSFGDSQGFLWDYSSQDTKDKYNELSPFVTQPVTYKDPNGVDQPGKKAGLNVYCKGAMQVRDEGSVKGSSNMPSISPVTFSVSSSGQHDISTRLANVECFGALKKEPFEQSCFRVYYYTANEYTTSATATKTITINVQDSGGGSCTMNEIDVDTSHDFAGDEDLIMVRVTMKNYGADPIKVTSVSGSNPQYNYYKLNKLLCFFLGISTSFCPVSSGFDEQINGGAAKNLYVLIQKKTPASSGGTILTFDAETISQTCGGAGTCDDIVSILGAVSCEIEPSSLSYGTQEVAEFEVTCYDLGGDPISCIGDNWYWLGMSGGFVEKDSTHALAYPTSPTGATGTLNYKSGIAHCWSDITVTSAGNDPDEDYVCEFIPPSADMVTGEQKYFILNCFKSGQSSTPDDADYYIIGGLQGTTSNSSVDGTTFTAGSPSAGDLMAYAFWNIPGDDPVLGAVAFAPITVTTGGGNITTNETGKDDENDGTSKWCKIGTGPLSGVYPGYSDWAPIFCGDAKDEPCDDVVWSSQGYASVYDSDDNGTMFTATGGPGDYGAIHACVDVSVEPGRCCWRGFNILEPECWEFS